MCVTQYTEERQQLAMIYSAVLLHCSYMRVSSPIEHNRASLFIFTVAFLIAQSVQIYCLAYILDSYKKLFR